MADGGAGVEATESEGSWEPEEASWIGDRAPCSGLAQLRSRCDPS